MAETYRAPFSVDFDVTLACNQSCRHCNVSGGRPLGREMKLDEVRRVIDEMHDIGVYDLAITGGEPLCRPDWRDIAGHAAQKPGWHMEINTNGTLWRDEDIDFWAARCPRAPVIVSLDGCDPRTYGALRGRGRLPADRAFYTVVRNISRMLEAGIAVSVNYTITTLTLGGLLPTYDYVRRLGVGPYLGIKFFPYGRGRRSLAALELSNGAWTTLLLDLTQKKRAGELPGFALSVTCPWELYLPLLPRGYTVEDVSRVWDYETPMASPRYAAARQLACTAGVTSCALSPDGSLYPCGTVSARIPGLYCGNVLHDGFARVWKESPLLRRLRALTVAGVGEPCVTCQFVRLCGGGCQARAFVASGRLGAPDPLCPLVNPDEKEG